LQDESVVLTQNNQNNQKNYNNYNDKDFIKNNSIGIISPKKLITSHININKNSETNLSRPFSSVLNANMSEIQKNKNQKLNQHQNPISTKNIVSSAIINNIETNKKEINKVNENIQSNIQFIYNSVK